MGAMLILISVITLLIAMIIYAGRGIDSTGANIAQ